MTRRLVIALVICAAGVGIGFGVLGRRADGPRKNAAYEAEMKQQVERSWTTARARCRDECMKQHGAELGATASQLSAKAETQGTDFFAGFSAGHALGTKIQTCIEACARVDVESRGAECQPR